MFLWDSCFSLIWMFNIIVKDDVLSWTYSLLFCNTINFSHSPSLSETLIHSLRASWLNSAEWTACFRVQARRIEPVWPAATASWPQLSLPNAAWTLSVIRCGVTAAHYSWNAYNWRWASVRRLSYSRWKASAVRTGSTLERSSKISFDKWRLYHALDRSSGGKKKTPGWRREKIFWPLRC